MSLHCWVAGLSFRDSMRSLVIFKELGVEPLPLHNKRNKPRWLGHLVGISLKHVSSMPNWEEAPSQTKDNQERLCFLLDL